jgi:hypothetical protein
VVVEQVSDEPEECDDAASSCRWRRSWRCCRWRCGGWTNGSGGRWGCGGWTNGRRLGGRLCGWRARRRRWRRCRRGWGGRRRSRWIGAPVPVRRTGRWSGDVHQDRRRADAPVGGGRWSDHGYRLRRCGARRRGGDHAGDPGPVRGSGKGGQLVMSAAAARGEGKHRKQQSRPEPHAGSVPHRARSQPWGWWRARRPRRSRRRATHAMSPIGGQPSGMHIASGSTCGRHRAGCRLPCVVAGGPRP